MQPPPVAAERTGAAPSGYPTIAVIDGPLDLGHPHLGDRVDLTHAWNYISGGPSVQASRATRASDHGTAVATLAAGTGDREARIVPLVVIGDNFSISGSDAAAAIRRAADLGADVINASFGGSMRRNPDLIAAINYAAERGSIIVFAAGNERGDQPWFPADAPGRGELTELAESRFVVVGCLDNADGLCRYSNRAGDSRENYIAYRGDRVTAGSVGGRMNSVSGTSFSTPQVSALLARLVAHWPDLPPEAAVEILFATATDLGTPGINATHGRGRADAAAALGPRGTAIAQRSLPGEHRPSVAEAYDSATEQLVIQ